MEETVHDWLKTISKHIPGHETIGQAYQSHIEPIINSIRDQIVGIIPNSIIEPIKRGIAGFNFLVDFLWYYFPAVSIIRTVRSHVREAKILEPERTSIDNAFIGGAKGLIHSGAAYWGASALPVPFLGGDPMALLALYALHNRSMNKRMRNIRNSSLTETELQSLFADPAAAAKLKYLWDLYGRYKRGDVNAKNELERIPGWEDEKFPIDLREPLEIREQTRSKIMRILHGLNPLGLNLPKIPKDLNLPTASAEQKQGALLNAMIRNIARTNPEMHNRRIPLTPIPIPYLRKGPKQGYFTHESAKDLILAKITTSKDTRDFPEAFNDPTIPTYWRTRLKYEPLLYDEIFKDRLLIKSYIDGILTFLDTGTEANIERRRQLMGIKFTKKLFGIMRDKKAEKLAINDAEFIRKFMEDFARNIQLLTDVENDAGLDNMENNNKNKIIVALQKVNPPPGQILNRNLEHQAQMVIDRIKDRGASSKASNTFKFIKEYYMEIATIVGLLFKGKFGQVGKIIGDLGSLRKIGGMFGNKKP